MVVVWCHFDWSWPLIAGVISKPLSHTTWSTRVRCASVAIQIGTLVALPFASAKLQRCTLGITGGAMEKIVYLAGDRFLMRTTPLRSVQSWLAPSFEYISEPSGL